MRHGDSFYAWRHERQAQLSWQVTRVLRGVR
ncbi:Uncharacterised protein [Bordetella pertussis]|nr:Uncharacterised protein [Bordetella pertussis]